MLTSNRDILFALFALVVGGCASTALFLRLFGSDSGENQVLEYLSEDKNHYVLRQDGRCIGSFDITVEDAKLLIVRGSGKVKLPQKGAFAKLSLQGFVNPLGQLFRFEGDFKLPGTMISLSAQGVHPIESTLTLKIRELRLDKDITLPGPVMFEHDERSDRYALRYSRLSSESSKPYEAVLKGVLGRLKLHLARESEACGSIEAVDVTQIVAEVHKMRSTFQGLIGNERMQQLLSESGA